MTPEKIVSIIEMYEDMFRNAGVPKKKIGDDQSFGSCSVDECLAHAHALCDGVKEYAKKPDLQRKTGSHLSSIQMILSFAGWFTLGELKDHNRPTVVLEEVKHQSFTPGITDFMLPSWAK